jgi:hypothetical protein
MASRHGTAVSAPYVPPCRCAEQGAHFPSCPHFDPAHDPPANATRRLTIRDFRAPMFLANVTEEQIEEAGRAVATQVDRIFGVAHDPYQEPWSRRSGRLRG